MAWTDDQIDRLTRLWNDGTTASRIAQIIGGNVTRNAVISKANRLGLQPRLNPVATRDFLFSRVCDRVIDAPIGHPISITAAAEAEGMNPSIAQALWDARIEATHGGDPL